MAAAAQHEIESREGILSLLGARTEALWEELEGWKEAKICLEEELYREKTTHSEAIKCNQMGFAVLGLVRMMQEQCIHRSRCVSTWLLHSHDDTIIMLGETIDQTEKEAAAVTAALELKGPSLS